MSNLPRFEELKAWNKVVLSTQSAHDQEKWTSATAQCKRLLDVLRPYTQKYNSSADLLSDLGALCVQAAETAYLLALALCQHGNDDLADTILTRLNCTYRLAPSVLLLNAQVMPATASAKSLDAFLPCVIRDAVSEALFMQLRSGLSATASFWTDHQYFEPETPFFSYFYQLDSNPGTVIDAAIQELHSLLLGSAYGPCMTGVTSAEWWAHCREPDEPHQLHFDLREAALRQGLHHYHLQHPLVSSVLFLTESGGPTLVLDQDPQGPLASRGWLVQPCPNQLLAFKGNLLHGVIPGRPNASTADESSHQQFSGGKRITLIVAWWGPDMRAEPGAPGQGPCRTAPSCLKSADKPTHLHAATSCSAELSPPVSQTDLQLSQQQTASVSQSQTDSQTDSESCSSSDADSDSEMHSHSSSEAIPKPSRQHWLHQCELTPQQLQLIHQQLQHPLANCISGSQVTTSQRQSELPCQHQASSSGHHNNHNSIQDSTDHHAEAMSDNSRRISHGDVRSTDCMDLHKLSEHHPVTLSPVWVPLGSLQQQNQQQPDAKRPKLNDRQDKEQQQLPVPPLRFFIQSPHEFASVYLPSRALE